MKLLHKEHQSNDFPPGHFPTKQDMDKQRPLIQYLKAVDDKPAPSIIPHVQKLLKNFQQLKLACCPISLAGHKVFWQALKTNQSITKLVFCSSFQLDPHPNAFIPQVAFTLSDALKDNSSIIEMNLSENRLGPQGAAALVNLLQGNTSIAKLHLARNLIGANGAIALAKGLENNNSITHLDLSSNWIEADGAIALAKALKKNISLTHLNLSANGIKANGIIALAEALKDHNAILELDLSSNCYMCDEETCALTTLLKTHPFLIIKCSVMAKQFLLSEETLEAFNHALEENKKNRLLAQEESRSKVVENKEEKGSAGIPDSEDFIDNSQQCLLNLQKLKTKIINELTQYNPWWKPHFFCLGPRHQQRLAAVIQALKTANTEEVIRNILKFQQAQFDSQDIKTEQPSPVINTNNQNEVSRFFQPNRLVNKKKGGYYQAITKALTLLQKEEKSTSPTP